jgi:hypothetical protein
MSDRHQRDRYDGYHGRTYQSDESGRWNESHDDRRYSERERYPRPPRSPPQERHYDREIDSYNYGEDRGRSNERMGDDIRDRFNEQPYYRDNSPSYNLGEGREERDSGNYGPSPSMGQDYEMEETEYAPKGPRSGRRRRPQQQQDQWDAGKPSAQVIFRGIDKSMTEADVSDFYMLVTITNSIAPTIFLQPRRCS